MMVIRTQINPLISALNGLIWLVGISVVLILTGLFYLNSEYENPDPIAEQSTIRTIESPKRQSLTPVQLKGKDLFVANCGQCHEVTDGVLVGPGLLGVSVRVPSQQWLVDWIKNPSAVVGSGDVYARAIVKKFAPVVMPGFSNLSEKDISAIIEYINTHESVGGAFTM